MCLEVGFLAVVKVSDPGQPPGALALPAGGQGEHASGLPREAQGPEGRQPGRAGEPKITPAGTHIECCVLLVIHDAIRTSCEVAFLLPSSTKVPIWWLLQAEKKKAKKGKAAPKKGGKRTAKNGEDAAEEDDDADEGEEEEEEEEKAPPAKKKAAPAAKKEEQPKKRKAAKAPAAGKVQTVGASSA